MTEFVKAVPCCCKADEIERRADAFAKEYGFVAERDSVRCLAEKLGGKVAAVDRPHFNELDGGSLEVNGPGDFLIKLSPITGPWRDNFTIAHELGHYVLHSGQPMGSEPIRVGRQGCDLIEREANRFAAALLMPKRRFMALQKKFGADPNRIASHFRVSWSAAAWRLVSFELSTREQLGLT